MDKICIKDIEVYGYHGVLPEEKLLGQKFYISIELMLNLKEAGKTDDLNKTIDYSNLCSRIENLFTKNKFNLIEKCSEELAQDILLNFELAKSVKVIIKKPNAPLKQRFEKLFIEIERKWHYAYLSLGSNIGNKEEFLNNAINMIDNKTSKVTKKSSFLKTKPVGYLEQDDFINCCIEIKTLLQPFELLKFLQEIEVRLNRVKTIRWGPRTIDIDIVLFDDEVISDNDLVIPHIRFHERMFVLEPLAEIAPYAIHPILKKRVIELKEILSGSDI